MPSPCLLCEFIGGIGTNGRKAHPYVCAHTHKRVLCVLEKKNKKPAWKIIRREKIQSQHFLPKLRKYLSVPAGYCAAGFQLQVLWLEQAARDAQQLPSTEQESVDVRQRNDSSRQAAQQHFHVPIPSEVLLPFSFSEENLV